MGTAIGLSNAPGIFALLPACGINTATYDLPMMTGLLLGLEYSRDGFGLLPKLERIGADVEDLRGLTVRPALR